MALVITALYAQRGTGELRLAVLDDTGSAIEASGSLLSQAIQLKQNFSTDDQGRFVARNLPFGVYRLNIERPGFGSFSALVEIRSEVPLDYPVTLRAALTETAIVVKRDSSYAAGPAPARPRRILSARKRCVTGSARRRAALQIDLVQWRCNRAGPSKPTAVLHLRAARSTTRNMWWMAFRWWTTARRPSRRAWMWTRSSLHDQAGQLAGQWSTRWAG